MRPLHQPRSLTCALCPRRPRLSCLAPRSGPLPDPKDGQFAQLRWMDLDGNSFEGCIGDGWSYTGIFTLVSWSAAS